MPETLDGHRRAILKVEAALELVDEAYGLWEHAEIRATRNRLRGAILELKDLDTYLKEQHAKFRPVTDVHLPD